VTSCILIQPKSPNTFSTGIELFSLSNCLLICYVYYVKIKNIIYHQQFYRSSHQKFYSLRKMLLFGLTYVEVKRVVKLVYKIVSGVFYFIIKSKVQKNKFLQKKRFVNWWSGNILSGKSQKIWNLTKIKEPFFNERVNSNVFQNWLVFT